MAASNDINPGGQPSREEMLDRARAMIPEVRERAHAAEKARRVPDETIAELHDNELFRIIQPRRVGGGEHDYYLLSETAAAIAGACCSTGWVFANLAVHSWMLAMWPEEAQNLVWGADERALISSSVIFPAGRAEAVDGGYLLTGRWPFCSGILHCEWIMFGALVSTGAQNQEAERRVFVVRTSDLEIIDTWDAMGLAATGSVDAACQKLFVPDFMTLPASATRGDLTPGSAVNPGPLYRQSVAGLFPNLIGTLMLGVAQGTWDLSVESLRERSARSSGTKISELVPIQMKIAETGTQIDAARALLKSNFDESRRSAEAGEMPPVEAKLRWRRDGSHIVKLASDATNGLHQIAGAGALYSSGHLQRHVRDVASGLTHAHVSWEINAPAYGRVALGLETDNPSI
jgi:3-hydroxy-9,10-secoandrosta-1,3,5(10)-triene-9,17-dione monooxygenase